MSPNLVTPDPKPPSVWSCCVATGLTFLAVGVVLVFTLRWTLQRQDETYSKERWERLVADLASGKTTCMIWPEPRFLEGFVRDQPELAAKVTQVACFTGKVSDERFGYVKQFPRLESIYLYEIWEGADSFLNRIAGMESVTDLSFESTYLSKEGMRAVARFPNLKRLHISRGNEDAIFPLRGHKKIEVLVFKEAPTAKEQINVIASLPHLRRIEIEQDDPIAAADLLRLQKALPKVTIERTDNGP